MKVSVIVPVYNSEEYLVPCLDSLIEQSLDRLEIILINDGSIDGSLDIIENYLAKHPEKIRCVSVENGGQGRARNIGIELAKGEYIGFVDSDDWVEQDMYEKLYTAAVAENADIAICDFLHSYSDGHKVYEKQQLGHGCVAAAGSACNKLFRADFIGTTRFTVGAWYEDFDFSARLLASSGKTISVFEPLYIYRHGHDSTMNNDNSAKNLDIVRVLKELDSYFTEVGKNDDFEYLLINHVLVDSINRVNLQKSPNKKRIIKKLRAYARQRIPSLSNCAAYREELHNRRIIMFLNYHGFTATSKLILRAKQKLYEIKK